MALTGDNGSTWEQVRDCTDICADAILMVYREDRFEEIGEGRQ